MKRVDIRLDLTDEEYVKFQEAKLHFGKVYGKYRVTYKEYLLTLSDSVLQWGKEENGKQ